MTLTDWFVGAGVTVFLVVLLGGYMRLVLLACSAGVRRLWQVNIRNPEVAAEPADVFQASSNVVNPWAETGFGPMGDPKTWCGTCAGNDERRPGIETSGSADPDDPWGAAPGASRTG